MVPQHEARSEQSVSGRFQVVGYPANNVKMSAIDVRADKSRDDRAFALICLVLYRHEMIDGLEKLQHILARAPAMNILRGADGALKRLRAFDEQIRESEQRRWRFHAGLLARKEPRQERRIFEIIGRVIGHFQDSTEDIRSRNASNRQARLLDDFIGPAFR